MLLHRLRDAWPDPDPATRVTVSSRVRRLLILHTGTLPFVGPETKNQLCRRLERVLRLSAQGRLRRPSVPFSIHSGRDDTFDSLGIDNYMPLSDWRDGVKHVDALDWE